jgi:hypothetical protein
MKTHRTKLARRTERQGQPNGFKTTCVCACLRYFGITESEFHYAQTIGDAVRILRNHGYMVRSRASFLKNLSVGKARAKLSLLVSKGVLGCDDVLLVRVANHALLLNDSGHTIVDTDQRKRDRRIITHAYRVSKMENGGKQNA